MAKDPRTPKIYGPKRIPPSGQIALPKELMRELDLGEGANVYLLVWQGRLLVLREADVGPSLESLWQELAVPDQH